MIGIYVRASSGTKETIRAVLDDQRKDGIKFAQGLGEPYTVYEDVALGVSLPGTGKFKDLLSDVEAGKINKVWVKENSRLSRSVEDHDQILKVFKEHNVELHISES